VTREPPCAITSAAINPAGPAPTTATLLRIRPGALNCRLAPPRVDRHAVFPCLD
jgi:hypothetical protein